jgi:plasmid stabilization system protein ParE
MAFEVIWSPRALRSLENVLEPLREQDPETAWRVHDGVYETTAVLERFPFIGAHYEPQRGRRSSFREVLFWQLRIFYRVDEPAKKVYIQLIWHGARDEPTFPE